MKANEVWVVQRQSKNGKWVFWPQETVEIWVERRKKGLLLFMDKSREIEPEYKFRVVLVTMKVKEIKKVKGETK